MRWKWLISIGLIVCLVACFALAACAPKAAPPAEEEAPPVEEEKPPVEEEAPPVAPIELIMASYMNKFTVGSLAMQYFGDRVTERTQGQITFKYYWDGTLGDAKEILPLISSGGADIGYVAIGYYPAEFTLLTITDVVMLSQHADSTGKAVSQLFDEYPELLDELDRVNLKPLLRYVADVNTLGSNRKIESVKDLRGMRVRVYGGLDTALIAAWGAVPVAMSSSDIYESMERGLLDGHNAQTLEDYGSKRLFETTKYCYDAGIGIYHAGYIPMNKDSFEALPDEFQKIIEEEAAATNERTGELLMESIRTALPKVLVGDMEISRLSPELVEELRELGLPAVKQAWLDRAVEGGIDSDVAFGVLSRYEELCKEYDASPDTKSGFEIYNTEFR